MRDFELTLDEYTLDLRAQRRSVRTIGNYKRSLRAWHDWLVQQPKTPATLADVRKEHIAGWLADRATYEAPNTVASRHRHLRAFFRWAEREEMIERSPMATLSEPTVPDNPPPVLTTEDLQAIFATTKRDTSFAGIRDHALMVLLADTGMRVGELVGMTLDAIDFDHGTIEIVGKFSRERTASISTRTAKVLLRYLRARNKQRAALETDRVWIGVRGPLQEAAVWRIVKTRGEAAGVKDVFPHQFRHTMAHRYRLHGGQEGDLMELGGWRDPKMIQRYGRSAAAERAVKAHQQVDHLRDVW